MGKEMDGLYDKTCHYCNSIEIKCTEIKADNEIPFIIVECLLCQIGFYPD